ncbi:MAG: ATP-binding cassette domain-containing protein [Chthonomonadaceae bacterium]|nr:ATP-binding cassette domain-containing protein [Chthonomonadaceae bacterium]
MIEGKGLSKAFGTVPVLRELTFRFETGKRGVLLGQSGTGKTTLLRLIAGLDLPDSGSLWIDGNNMQGVPPHARGIGFLFQAPALWPHMTVLQNALFAMEEPDEPRVRALLARVGLGELADRFPHEVSGGQARRAALVRALAPRKPILLLDEPFAHLGHGPIEAVWELIDEEAATCGATVVAAVHESQEAERWGGTVVDLNR